MIMLLIHLWTALLHVNVFLVDGFSMHEFAMQFFENENVSLLLDGQCYTKMSNSIGRILFFFISTLRIDRFNDPLNTKYEETYSPL